jgi:hypothetical protein
MIVIVEKKYVDDLKDLCCTSQQRCPQPGAPEFMGKEGQVIKKGEGQSSER